MNTKLIRFVVGAALTVFLVAGLFVTSASAHTVMPHNCQTVQATPGFDQTIQPGTDPLEHHYYVSIPYQQSGKYAVYDATLNQWFDQNSGIWGYYNGTTRYGIHSLWVGTHWNNFWQDQWVVFDYNC